jgi:hypothetical protein
VIRLYVAATRGRDENVICVVTDTHDPADAIDVPQRILATDRADQPALTIQRDLAAAVTPAPVLQPRCEVPDWFHPLLAQAVHAMVDAEGAIEAHESTDIRIRQRIDALDRQIVQLAPLFDPHVAAITNAETAVRAAEQAHSESRVQLAHTGRIHRRDRRDIEHAADDVTAARATRTPLRFGVRMNLPRHPARTFVENDDARSARVPSLGRASS